MSRRSGKSRPLALVALVLAWFVPGAGHAYLGRVWRGAILFVTISAVFWTGVAVGGVLTVDYYDQRWWFAAQMFTGINGLVGWYRQQQVYDELARDEEVGPLLPPTSPGAAHQQSIIQKKLAERGIYPATTTASVARVYAGVAGLLNIMCIFDAVVLALMGQAGEPKPQPYPRKPAGQTT